MRDDQHKRLAV